VALPYALPLTASLLTPAVGNRRRQRLPTAGVKRPAENELVPEKRMDISAAQGYYEGQQHTQPLRQETEQVCPDSRVENVVSGLDFQIASGPRHVLGREAEKSIPGPSGPGCFEPDEGIAQPSANVANTARTTRRRYGIVGMGLRRVVQNSIAVPRDREAEESPPSPKLLTPSRVKDDWPDSRQWLEMSVEEVASAVRAHAERARQSGAPIEVQMSKDLAAVRCA
jgi:hypothetical protein